jgi:hypothetical protein
MGKVKWVRYTEYIKRVKWVKYTEYTKRALYINYILSVKGTTCLSSYKYTIGYTVREQKDFKVDSKE